MKEAVRPLPENGAGMSEYSGIGLRGDFYNGRATYCQDLVH